MKKTVIILLASILFIYSCDVKNENGDSHTGHNHATGETKEGESKRQEYTCAMHPSVRSFNADDKCPICNMDLIPLEKQKEVKVDKNKYQCENFPDIKSEKPGECPADGTAMIKIPRPIYTQFMNKKKILVSGIKRYTIKSNQEFISTINTTGKISYDERNMKHISAQFPGRVERLWINYEGQLVKKGDKVLTIYSPKLIDAQNELISIIKFSKSNNSQILSAKKRLKLLGISNWQINQIVKKLKPIDKIVIYAPFTGIITKKMAHEKMYFKEGQNFFDIVDISTVWALIDIYEYDIEKIKLNSDVTLSFIADIKDYNGKIEYISPYLNLKNRTVNARISLENTDGKYLPNMFLNAQIKINYNKDNIVVPRGAVLSLGKNKVVFKDLGNNHFEAWRVKVIAYNDTQALLKKSKNLSDGDNIVQKGGFIIDSQSQISGNSSSLYGNSIEVK